MENFRKNGDLQTKLGSLKATSPQTSARRSDNTTGLDKQLERSKQICCEAFDCFSLYGAVSIESRLGVIIFTEINDL